ncbi:MAG: hypothetical protein ACRDBL_09190 [Rhabdaerophilum sp.]
MSAPQITRPLSPELNRLWSEFRARLDAASAPFTGGKPLALPAFYAHDIPQLSAEMTRQLSAMPSNTAGQFHQDAERRLMIVFTKMKGGTP